MVASLDITIMLLHRTMVTSDISDTPATDRNAFETDPGTGGWGGACTCPNGQVYQVGDNNDSCGSLACFGGTSGPCNKQTGTWSGNKVICAGKFSVADEKIAYPTLPQAVSWKIWDIHGGIRNHNYSRSLSRTRNCNCNRNCISDHNRNRNHSCNHNITTSMLLIFTITVTLHMTATTGPRSLFTPLTLESTLIGA